MRTDVLGVGFDNITMDTALERALGHVDKHDAACVVTPNPEIVWLARKDDALRAALAEADLVLADGIGVIYGAKILGRPLVARNPGIEFAEKLLEKLAARSGRVYLLGAKPGVAEEAAAAMEARFPGLHFCGTHHGYFQDDADIIADINEKKPDLLLVCLGAPKQEKWMHSRKALLSVGLMAGLGGALDVLSGRVERAPEKWRKANLEWLYRILKEPKRIGRAMRLPAFLCAVVWARIRGK